MESGPGALNEIARLPVTAVCGFVGAGKSTLVQKVVAGWASGRLAVLVHDRSDAGLDADLCRSLGIEVFCLGEVLGWITLSVSTHGMKIIDKKGLARVVADMRSAGEHI